MAILASYGLLNGTTYNALVKNPAKPAFFIPTLYFIEGLPYALVASVSIIVLQNLGESKKFIGEASSLLALPWTLKFIWAPLVDLYGIKRTWIVISHMVLAALSVVAAAVLHFNGSVSVLLFALACMALMSATQDVSMDGYYLEVLDKGQQSFYVGVRNAAYRVANIFGQGGLVFLAGYLAQPIGIRSGWAVAFALAGAIFLIAYFLHSAVLPPGAPAKEKSKEESSTNQGLRDFGEVFTTFFQRPRMAVIVFYMMFFRLGDALLFKMSQPFLLDKPELGGMGVSTQDLGLIYGGVGTSFLLLGGFLGGYVVSKFGLKKTLLPTALIQNSAIVLYYILSKSPPNLLLIAVFNAFEQFAYGLGLTAYTVFLLSLASEKYRSGHYAIATAFMALGLLIPGYFSGTLCTMLGYQNFFLLSFVLAIPGMIAIFFLPLPEEKKAENTSS